jgi:hypothetical protein
MIAVHLSKNILAGLCALPLVAANQARAATVTNLDAEPFVLIVTEGGNRAEFTVRTGQTLEFCLEGCFVMLPNGDRNALSGDEAYEISGGRITRK